jgi:hypothetical protein
VQALANEIVLAKADAILAIAAPGVTAASKATRSTPIVAVDLESDPIASGFAASLSRPGGNITGLFLDFPELSGKWIGGTARTRSCRRPLRPRHRTILAKRCGSSRRVHAGGTHPLGGA